MSDKTELPRLNTRQSTILMMAQIGQFYSLRELRDLIAGEQVDAASPATLRRDLSQLVKAGFFVQSGERKSTQYLLRSERLPFVPVDAHQYCTLDIDTRPANARFNFVLFASFSGSVFTEGELQKLHNATQVFNQTRTGITPAIAKKELERFVIELAWKSSKIEGNTYSLLDTELLIKEGIEATGKTRQEAIMILNHKKAFEFSVVNKHEAQSPTPQLIQDIHRLLVEELGIEFGFRTRLIGITGSRYRPLDVPSQIKEAVELLLQAVHRQNDPYSQALLLLAGIAYIQPFEDGNKRTSRLSANALLVANDCAPLSYRSISEVAYREAMLTFYERNSIVALKELFMQQYLFACDNYLKFV